jgi:SAM-dependent methyltransferase
MLERGDEEDLQDRRGRGERSEAVDRGMSEQLTDCPVCRDGAPVPVEIVRGFEILRCRSCGLTFTSNPELDLVGYELSYGGEAGILEDSRTYFSPASRLSLEAIALWRPPPHLTAAERWTLERIAQRVPPGNPVLDIGCGTGRFLEALRRRGYLPAGVEPVASLAATLQGLGYDVRVGKVPGLGWQGGQPAAVTLFEVLEHLPQPMPVLRELRTCFPQAVLSGSVPSPIGGSSGAGDYPPNHFLRWTPEALRQALSGAGYGEVEVVGPPPRGSELVPGASKLIPLPHLHHRGRGPAVPQPPSSTPKRSAFGQRIGATLLISLHRLALSGGDLIATPWARGIARRGRTSASLVFWAEP